MLKNWLCFEFTQLAVQIRVNVCARQNIVPLEKIALDQTILVLNQSYFRPIEEQGLFQFSFHLMLEIAAIGILSSVLFDFFFSLLLYWAKNYICMLFQSRHSINSSSSSHVKVRFLHSNSTWYVPIKVLLGFNKIPSEKNCSHYSLLPWPCKGSNGL